MSCEEIEKQIRQQTKESPASPVTLKRDVPYELVYYLRENQGDFPGVSVERVYVRSYPQGDPRRPHLRLRARGQRRAARRSRSTESLAPGDEVGQTGVEYAYDHAPARHQRRHPGPGGRHRRAQGRPAQLRRSPGAGNNLRLTLDSSLQAAGEAAMASFGLPGGFVAMDVDTGEILGLGSAPDASTRRSSPRPSSRRPSSDAIFGGADGHRGPDLQPRDPGRLSHGLDLQADHRDRRPRGGPDHARRDRRRRRLAQGRRRRVQERRRRRQRARSTCATALQVSSDVYFYKLGLRGRRGGRRDPELGPPARPRQPHRHRPASRGRGAGARRPEWRNELYRDGLTDRPWSVGDNINLSVGQGDLQASPLQLAVAYATVANGGNVVRPHVGMRVEDPAGRVIQEVDPAPRARGRHRSGRRARPILDGLHAAAMEPSGTSYGVFGGFPVEIAGKTGTAERGVTSRRDHDRGPVLVRRARPVPGPRGRRRRDDRARRLRRRLRRPRPFGRSSTDYFDVKPGEIDAGVRPGGDGVRMIGAPSRTTRPPAARPGAGALARGRAGAARSPFGERETGHARARLRRPRPRPGGRGDRDHRVQRVHARGHHPGGHPGRPLLLRDPPGDLRGRRASR